MANGRNRIHPVILSGGSGTRLWPLSRETYPKQLIALLGEESLLQQTARRLGAGFAQPLVVANQAHRFIVAEQLRAIGREPLAILLEPTGRNTAPAAAVAALRLLRDDPEAVMALLPADHAIGEVVGFRAAVERAGAAARAGHLVTFGVVPTRPETGYGYIRADRPLDGHDGLLRVAAFVEKPDAATAEAYLGAGGYLWNSGMFVMAAQSYLEELERLQPAVLAAAERALRQARADIDFLRLDEAAFAAAPSISIDYAVMEQTARAAVLPVDIGWSDIGAWHTLWELSAKDAAGNVTQGPVRLRDARGCYLRSDDGRLLAGLGIEDLVVVSTKDATLVAPRGRAGEVGELVAALRAEGCPETSLPPVVYRPWGSYEDLVEGDRFRVKRLVVKPGERLSLQYHHHRAEHWVVVAGEATATRGEQQLTLSVNESVFIPQGETHRLENRTPEPLVLIEVQCGDYVGEDDIVRLEDLYGRLALA